MRWVEKLGAFCVVASLLCGTLWLSGCGGPERADEVTSLAQPTEADPAPAQDEGDPVRGDWLVIHSLADPESLNPLTSNDSASNQVLRWIFLPLLDLDNETLMQRPLIAASLPEVAEDKLTYTFRLREDVTFGDGHPLTAADVVFTLKVIKHPFVDAPHARNYYDSVRDVVAVDEHTLRFELGKKYFRNDLVLGSTQPIPRHYYDPEGLLDLISVSELADLDTLPEEKKQRAIRFAERFNQGFHRNPLGPGPFVLADPERDYQTGVKIVLRRRPSPYWAPNEPTLGDAWVERIVFRIINDREAALVTLKRGDVDLVSMTPLQYRINKNNARFHDKVATKIHVSPGYSYIGWNLKRPIFQDARVRRALSHLVDKQNIVDKILHGFGVPIESPIFVERPEYNRKLAPYLHDPAQGKALLAEAGWKDTDGDGILDREIDGVRVPLRFEMISNSGNDIRRDVGLAVIDAFKKVGIDATFRAMDWSIMLEQVGKFDFDAVILGWGMSVLVPDAYQVWHSSQAVQGGSNHVYFKNKEVDRILEDYRVEFDAGRRKELYDRFQEILYAEQPYTFLFMQNAITAWDRRFRGVSWYPSGSTDLHEWWVAAKSQKYD